MKTGHPSVHAIIVSYKDGGAVARCVQSLLATGYPGLRVIVVDNASGDGTVEDIRARFPQCRVVANATNVGFGSGCNAGIEIANAEEADFILLLNQDTVVEEDLPWHLVACMQAHPRAGAVAPKTCSSERLGDGSPRRLYAGAWRGVLPLIQNIPGIEERDAPTPDRPIRTDYAWGHGVMLRASAVAEVGAFDPAFFMYCEDLDLCRRMESAGYEIWCEPRALMWHDISDGARADRSELWRWVFKVQSNRNFHRKHYGWLASPFLNLGTVLVETKRLLNRRRFRAAGHLLQAYVTCLFRRSHRSLRDPRPHAWPLILLNATALLMAARFLNGELGEWGGDNVHFLLLAEALASGRGYVDLFLRGLPPHFNYPPVYPLLLAPLVSAGAPLIVLKGFTAALGLAGLNVCYALLTRWHDRGTALLALISTLCCGIFLDSGLSIMSESPFLFFSAVTILLVQRSFDSAERRPGLWMAAGAMMGLTVLTRLTGVVIAPATILFAGFLPSPRVALGERMRRLAILGATAAILAGPWFVWRFADETKSASSYYQEFERGDTIREKIRARAEDAPQERALWEKILTRPLDNLWDLATRLSRTAMPEPVRAMGPGWAMALLAAFLSFCVVLALLSAIGLLRGLRSLRRAQDFYVLVYLFLLSVWIGGGFRLFMPLLPFLFAYVSEGLVVLWRTGSRARRAGQLALAFSIVVNLTVTFQFPLIRDRLAGHYAPWWGDLLKVSCRLAEVARPGQTVIAAPDNVVFYLTGLQAVRVPLRGDASAVFDRVLASEADYLVITPFERWRYKKIRVAAREHPDRLPVILAEGEVEVRRILRDLVSKTTDPVGPVGRPARSSKRCAEIVR